MPRVLLADDDAAFREQLAAILEQNLADVEVVASVADGHEAVAAAMSHAPAVAVIDYAMPGPTGGHAAAVIQQALPNTTVIVVSGLPPEDVTDLPSDVRLVRKGAALEQELLAAIAAQA
ncbi:MAG TPA: response regulator [Gaiellaceae bacterium]|nr:response regulator [Gaiellaceae bacterium]